jgi:hypothetical protein
MFKRTKFEYELIEGTLTKAQLNDLGEKGWELVSASPVGVIYQFIFKRKK